MGDIQSMFHQVRVAEEDRDFIHVHLFRAVSYPSCTAFALSKTADDHQSEFWEEVVQTLKENLRVWHLKKKQLV